MMFFFDFYFASIIILQIELGKLPRTTYNPKLGECYFCPISCPTG